MNLPSGEEVIPVWLNDKYLLGLLLLQAVQLLSYFGKQIWNREAKRLDEIYEAVKHIPPMLKRLDVMEEKLSDVPTHEHVELAVLRKIHSKKDI